MRFQHFLPAHQPPQSPPTLPFMHPTLFSLSSTSPSTQPSASHLPTLLHILPSSFYPSRIHPPVSIQPPSHPTSHHSPILPSPLIFLYNHLLASCPYICSPTQLHPLLSGLLFSHSSSHLPTNLLLVRPFISSINPSNHPSSCPPFYHFTHSPIHSPICPLTPHSPICPSAGPSSTISPPIHPSIYPSIPHHPPIYPSVSLSVHPLPSSYPPIHLYVHPPPSPNPSIHPFVYMSISHHPPTHPSIHSSICSSFTIPPAHSFIHLSIPHSSVHLCPSPTIANPSIHLSIPLSIFHHCPSHLHSFIHPPAIPVSICLSSSPISPLLALPLVSHGLCAWGTLFSCHASLLGPPACPAVRPVRVPGGS